MAGITKTSKYTYRSTGHGGGDANVSIEYSADLSALTRLEVSFRCLAAPLARPAAEAVSGHLRVDRQRLWITPAPRKPVQVQ